MFKVAIGSIFIKLSLVLHVLALDRFGCWIWALFFFFFFWRRLRFLNRFKFLEQAPFDSRHFVMIGPTYVYSPHFDGWSNLLLVLFLPNLDRVWYKLTWTFLSYWLALIFILNIVALFYEWFLNVLQLLPLDLFGFVGSLYKMVASVVLEKKNLEIFL